MPAEYPYRTRRTIKPNLMDRSRAVDHGLLLEILEDANWAPTHGMTQPWRFHVFIGDARSTLGSGLVSIYEQITPSNEVRQEKRAKLRSNCEQAPVIIAVAARVEPNGKIRRSTKFAPRRALCRICFFRPTSAVSARFGPPPLPVAHRNFLHGWDWIPRIMPWAWFTSGIRRLVPSQSQPARR